MARKKKAGRAPSPEGRVTLNLTVPPYVAQRLKASGNASAAVKALVDADAKIRMQSEYETMVMMGHPTEFALGRISSQWGVSIDDLRSIVGQYSAEATAKSAQTINDAQTYLRKQAEIEQRKEARQHKPDPQRSKLNR